MPKQLVVTIPDDLHAWLKDFSWRCRESMSEVVRDMLDQTRVVDDYKNPYPLTHVKVKKEES